jgi:NADH:ubiquinone oxidoreductase subunit H
MNLNILFGVIYTLFKILVIIIPLMLGVAYYTYIERKVLLICMIE